MTTTNTIELVGRRPNRVGLGTNRLTDSPRNRRFLEQALEAGVGLIDTARLYTDGASEATIAAALDPRPENVVVATKGGYHGGIGIGGLRQELETSLECLGGSIDLYYLHRHHPETAIEEKMELLAGYAEDGRIGGVGLSEVSVEEIEAARSVVPIAAVQNEFSLAERRHDDVIDHCEREDIAFVPFFPLRGADSGPAAEVAERHERTANQIAIAWLLHRSPVLAPIPGTLSIEHLRENLAAAEIELDAEDLAALA